MRAVVGRYHGNRLFTCFISGIQKSRNLTDIACRPCGACGKIGCYSRKLFAFAVNKAVAFFRDCKRAKLKRIGSENLFHSGKFGIVLRIQYAGFRNRAYNGLFDGTVCLQRNKYGKVVVRAVLFFNNFIIKSLCNNQPLIRQAFIEHSLCEIRVKSAENIACTEVYPHRSSFRSCRHGIYVKMWKIISLGEPFLFIV